MDLSSITIDKFLLTVLASAIAGLLTAALSVVKLVNAKESKTTEYRQSWTESLRASFADLISNLTSIAATITFREELNDELTKLTNPSEEIQSRRENQKISEKIKFLAESIKQEDSHIRELKRNLYKSYSFTRLHFKQGDETFPLIEHKFDVIMEMMDRLVKIKGSESLTERRELREKIYAATTDITINARIILKKVWEEVKQGEETYVRTKDWSVRGGAISIFIIAILFTGSAIYIIAYGKGVSSINKNISTQCIACSTPPSPQEKFPEKIESIPTKETGTQIQNITISTTQPSCPTLLLKTPTQQKPPPTSAPCNQKDDSTKNSLTN